MTHSSICFDQINSPSWGIHDALPSHVWSSRERHRSLSQGTTGDTPRMSNLWASHEVCCPAQPFFWDYPCVLQDYGFSAVGRGVHPGACLSCQIVCCSSLSQQSCFLYAHTARQKISGKNHKKLPKVYSLSAHLLNMLTSLPHVQDYKYCDKAVAQLCLAN